MDDFPRYWWKFKNCLKPSSRHWWNSLWFLLHMFLSSAPKKNAFYFEMKVQQKKTLTENYTLYPLYPTMQKRKWTCHLLTPPPPKKKDVTISFLDLQAFFQSHYCKNIHPQSSHTWRCREKNGGTIPVWLWSRLGRFVGMFKRKLLQTSKKQNVKRQRPGSSGFMKFIGFMPSTFTLIIEIVQPKKLFTLPHSFFSAVYVSACRIFNASHHELFT